jgi:hypothetical protein
MELKLQLDPAEMATSLIRHKMEKGASKSLTTACKLIRTTFYCLPLKCLENENAGVARMNQLLEMVPCHIKPALLHQMFEELEDM